MTRPKTTILTIVGCLVLQSFYVLSAGRVILNGSGSLPHNAYFMVTWPKLVPNGAYVALKTPDALKQTLGDTPLVKQVRGIAGDRLVHRGEALCIHDTCFKAEQKPDDTPLGLTPSQIIPDGQFAAFGTSENSLDSRYKIIGLFRVEDVIAVGFPIPFPHWTEVKAWIDG